jgi:transcriptional regulator with XRE-family HTH domain
MKNIGEKIISLRTKLNITQAELARRIELTPAAVSLIEKNERKPSLEVLTKIAEALGVTSSHFLDESDSSKNMSDKHDPKINVMLRGYAELSDQYKDLLFDYYKLLEQKDKESK